MKLPSYNTFFPRRFMVSLRRQEVAHRHCTLRLDWCLDMDLCTPCWSSNFSDLLAKQFQGRLDSHSGEIQSLPLAGCLLHPCHALVLCELSTTAHRMKARHRRHFRILKLIQLGVTMAFTFKLSNWKAEVGGTPLSLNFNHCYVGNKVIFLGHNDFTEKTCIDLNVL